MILLPLVSTAETEQKVNQKEPKATDIKIHKKQVLSDDERKAIDEARGKPTDKKPTGRVPSSWASGVLGNPLPAGGEKYAIVVGLANYTGTVNDLCVADAETSLDNPTVDDGLAYYCQDRDAFSMNTALLSFGYAEENIVHLRDYQATRSGIWEAMNNLKSKVGPNDEIVFFFSGHGASGRISGDKEAIDEAIFTYNNNYIWDDELKIWADSLSVYRAIFAFDICLAGGMNDIAGANRVIAMSSGENQSSWTYSLGGGVSTGGTTYSEGLFSHYFIVDGMTNGLADGSNLASFKDYNVAVEEAFSYTYPIIKAKQTPVLNDKFYNDLLLGYQL